MPATSPSPHGSGPALTIDVGSLRLEIHHAERPATLRATLDGAEILREHPLVEVLGLHEGNERMTQSPVGSAIGDRLRVIRVVREGDGLIVEQGDPLTGLRVTTVVEVFAEAPALRFRHRLAHRGTVPLVLAAVPALSVRTAAEPADLRLLSGRSEWLGEGRWTEVEVGEILPDLGFSLVHQPDRGGYGQVSTGGWSTGAVLPTAVLAADGGQSVAWQIETSAGWSWNLSRGTGGVTLTAGGPDDRHHDAAVRVGPGDEFTTDAVGLALSTGGRDGALASLTRYRRSIRMPRPADRESPVVYNDYMNTLMGQPTTQALLPLIGAAAEAGAEVFCIDAGWFSDEVDYWAAVGEWREAPTRFTGGLDVVIAAIRAAGLRPGLWLEPESVGLDSPVATSLPPAAFFVRDGAAVVQQRRKHLDLRNPAARDHLDETVDFLVGRYGIAFFKLDYNIEPGAGTDAGDLAPGAGLLAHTRALRAWLVDVQRRHPRLLIENCASGAMRGDYHLLSAAHLQSTSDQQDPVRYAAIACAAPASFLPEQAGNWAYPAPEMTRGELVTTLVNGLAGRFYLSGFLDRLGDEERALVHEAVDVFTRLRGGLAESTPFWPLGVPGWGDSVLALGLDRPDGSAVLAVWNRGPATEIRLEGVTQMRPIFPRASAWGVSVGDGGVTLVAPEGPDAALMALRRVTAPTGGATR